MASINPHKADRKLSPHTVNEPNRSSIDAIVDNGGNLSFSCAFFDIENHHPLER